MNTENLEGNMGLVTRLMFRLLPVQILMMTVVCVNDLITSFFASNYIGLEAMSAIGLMGPVDTLLGAVCTVFTGGASILCGKYMGQNDHEKVQNVFCLDLFLTGIVGALFASALLVIGVFNLSGFLTSDAAVRPVLNQYMIGSAIGTLPYMLSTQLAVFLSLENQQKLMFQSSILYVVVVAILDILFVLVLHMGAFGLALAYAIADCVFLFVQIRYFTRARSSLHLSLKHLQLRESGEILKVGIPGALSDGYQTVRGFIVNGLLLTYVGSVGVSAFSAANTLLNVFWAIPVGMLTVSRMLISVSVGEEDRQSLTDIMRVMFSRYVPLMCIISATLSICAVPLTRIYFRDPSEAVYGMTVLGLRILPLCMPFIVICMHFICYGQITNKQGLVHVLSIVDGFVCVAGFAIVFTGYLGIKGPYWGNVFNGVVTFLIVIGYAWLMIKHFPRNMEDLMVIRDSFGVEKENRLDLSVRSMEDVLTVSRQVIAFCRSRGIDEKRAYYSGLFLEEMAGNVVSHGFRKDSKKHAVDIRVVYKDDDVILRIRDDCVPFNPAERKDLVDPNDKIKNMGIRMVYKGAKDVQYQYLVGLNVLTIRI